MEQPSTIEKKKKKIMSAEQPVTPEVLDEVLNVAQHELLIALASSPPDLIDPANRTLDPGTKAIFEQYGVLDAEGYLTPLGVEIGLAFQADDDVAQEYEAGARPGAEALAGAIAVTAAAATSTPTTDAAARSSAGARRANARRGGMFKSSGRPGIDRLVATARGRKAAVLAGVAQAKARQRGKSVPGASA